jgi:uncharacterized hydrophobic protein (TIGR00271 family)
MRLVQLSVSDDERDDVVDVLEEYDLGYTVTAGAGEQDDRSLVGFLAPADAVEYVLADLREEGVDESQFTVTLNAEFSTFEGIDAVQDDWQNSPNRIASQALRSKAKSMRPNTRAYLWMMLLSTVVATSGLLMDSPAVVVGSMVIAPVVGPMLTAGIGAVRNDQDMLVRSLQMQGFGLGAAVIGAVLFGYGLKWLGAAPTTLDVAAIELIGVRLAPSILSVAVGLAAGAAGAFGLATKGQVSLVGVMIAAALIPTAAVVGIGVAWGNAVVAVGALVLLVLSTLAVNLGVLLSLVYLGYRPDTVDRGILDFGSAREASVVVATLALSVLVIAAVTLGFLYQASFERETTAAVTETIGEDPYRDLDVVTISAQYVSPWTVDSQPTVTVTLTKNSTAEYPGLPNGLDERITERTGRDVIVRVQYVEYNRSMSSRTAPAPNPAGANP